MKATLEYNLLDLDEAAAHMHAIKGAEYKVVLDLLEEHFRRYLKEIQCTPGEELPAQVDVIYNIISVFDELITKYNIDLSN